LGIDEYADQFSGYVPSCWNLNYSAPDPSTCGWWFGYLQRYIFQDPKVNQLRAYP
jgi:hypothetical protein